MIEASMARQLMPSTIARNNRREELLKNIEDKITEAAKLDRSSVEIKLYNYEIESVKDILHFDGYVISKISENETNTATGEDRAKYEISWRYAK